MDITPEDRYQILKAKMDKDRKEIDAQKANQEMERVILEMEHKYGLMAEHKTIDPRTASIRAYSKSKNGSTEENNAEMIAIG